MNMVSAVVAQSKNRVIGKDGRLPWSMPADLKHFKDITSGHTVAMGQRTFASIGRPLPNRRNIVVTRDENFSFDSVEAIHSIEEIEKLANDGDIFIIGGGQIFAETLPFTDRIYLTEVDVEIADGDAYFPELKEDEWQEKSREHHGADEKNKYDYDFIIYDRVS